MVSTVLKTPGGWEYVVLRGTNIRVTNPVYLVHCELLGLTISFKLDHSADEIDMFLNAPMLLTAVDSSRISDPYIYVYVPIRRELRINCTEAEWGCADVAIAAIDLYIGQIYQLHPEYLKALKTATHKLIKQLNRWSGCSYE